MKQLHGKQLVKSMGVMFVLMMIIAGMAVALAIYFLLSAVFSVEPQMTTDTIDKFGILPSVLVFALCGPVLVLKLLFGDDGTDKEKGGAIALLTSGTVAVFWSAVLGVAVTHGVSAAIAPMMTSL